LLIFLVSLPAHITGAVLMPNTEEPRHGRVCEAHGGIEPQERPGVRRNARHQLAVEAINEGVNVHEWQWA
jgi:hypothetical protein